MTINEGEERIVDVIKKEIKKILEDNNCQIYSDIYGDVVLEHFFDKVFMGAE